jgi:hypothetical protein
VETGGKQVPSAIPERSLYLRLLGQSHQIEEKIPTSLSSGNQMGDNKRLELATRGTPQADSLAFIIDHTNLLCLMVHRIAKKDSGFDLDLEAIMEV